jgi:hypothetical protein
LKKVTYSLDEFAHVINERLAAIVSMQALFYEQTRVTNPAMVSAFAANLSDMIARAQSDGRDVPDMEWVYNVITSSGGPIDPRPGPKLRIVDPG